MSAPTTGSTGATRPNVMGTVASILLAVVSAFGLVGTIIFGPQAGRGNFAPRGQYPSGMATGMPTDMPTPGRGGGGMRGNGGVGMGAPINTWNIVVIVLFALIFVGSIVFLILALRSRPTAPSVIPVVAVAGMPGYGSAGVAPVVTPTMPASPSPMASPTPPQPDPQPTPPSPESPQTPIQ